MADRGYDSDPMRRRGGAWRGAAVPGAARRRLARRGIDLTAPYRCNSVLRRYQDKRKLRRYRKRWKIERSIAWVRNFRRVYVRYDRILAVYLGVVCCACLLITLRHL